MRTLKYGCRGADVRFLQYFLNECVTDLVPLVVDDHFGSLTKARVIVLQERTGLKGDGSVGPLTRTKWGLSDFHVHIFDSNHKLWVAGTPYGSNVYPLRTLAKWAAIEGADYTYNLALFNMSDKGKKTDQYGTIKGRTITHVVSKGKTVGYNSSMGTEERLYIDGQNYFAGAKLGIKNGKKASRVFDLRKRARNATGRLKDGRFFIVQTVTTATEGALVDYMLKNYNVDLMLFQDGGGSTGMYDAKRNVLLAGEKEGSNGRPVATVICVKETK